MDNNRRNFLFQLGLGLTFFKDISKGIDDWVKPGMIPKQKDNLTIIHGILDNSIIKPKGLKKGSMVAITSPASHSAPWDVARAKKIFQQLGCKVVLGDNINKKSNYGYLAASDEERADELMNFFYSPEIDCVLCGRGGFGSMRILNLLNYEDIRCNPKILLGFSDITALINAIYVKSRIVCYHGPVAVSTLKKFSVDSIYRTIFDNPNQKPIIYSNPKYQIINKGKCFGRLVGGNLTLLASTLGTEYEIDTKDSILIFEEVSEEPYKIDRMLSQLYLAGKLTSCKGIIVGYIKNLDVKKHFYPGPSYTVRQVIENRIKSLGIPAILGAEFGHLENTLTIPIGIMAELDADNKKISLLESTVN